MSQKAVALGVTVAALGGTPTISSAQDIAGVNIRNALEDCLWGMAFDENTDKDKQLSLILNLLAGGLGSGAVTSAITSPQELCVDRGRASAAFIQGTYAQLIEETARGEGQHLSALLTFVGCEQAVQPTVVGQMRENIAVRLESGLVKPSDYEEIMAASTADQCPA